MGMPLFDDAWRQVLARRSAEDLRADMDTAGLIGIDTASYQGSPDWSAVAASGIGFCYIKSSEGTSSTYPSLDPQYHGAGNAGIVRGLYHFCRPDLASPEANCDAFADQINRLGAVKGHLPPALDLEVGDGNLAAWVQRFIYRLRDRTGCSKVMVYSSSYFYSVNIGEPAWMDDDIHLWIAGFGRPPGQPGYLTPRVAIHQYAEDGHVPGISGQVDLNFAIKPLSELVDTEELDLTAEESSALLEVRDLLRWLYGQFAGLGPDGTPAQFPSVPGWSAWPGGTDESLSLLDFLRRSNVETRQASNAIETVITKLEAQPAVITGGGTGLSEDDVNRFADAVIARLADRLGDVPSQAA